MKKIELLAPSGNIECLKMAVKCGADAIYISGKEYGARKYAENFTLKQIEEAVKYCHLYGVKLFVTVNTLIEEENIDNVTDYIRKLHIAGVDALIMQDIGLITHIKEKFPNLEIHASTQTHNCNKECVEFLKNLGVTRVVLARELSLEEIEKINTDIELEVFIHGALCVSYSGQCLISSKLFGRSGNKGECAQVCRFCFDLYKNNEKQNIKENYLLSMKELCTEKTIKNLIETGISSLKIEGRMKSKYYVGYVTKFYRMLIDKYYKGEELNFTKEEYQNLEKLYNRQFTTGFLNSDKKIVNPKTCNHQGIKVGGIISLGDKIKIKLKDTLTQTDGIRLPNGEGMTCNYIYNDKGMLINKAHKNDYIYLDNKVNLTKKGEVYKTLDTALHKEIEDLPPRKVDIELEITAKKEEPLKITIKCEKDQITKTSSKVEESVNKPTTKEDIKEKLSKLGNTPFNLKNINYNIDNNIFIPVKNLNNLRQELTKELIEIRENKKIEFIEKELKPKQAKEINLTKEYSFLVRNEDQLKTLINKPVTIYVENYNLYQKYKKENVYYRPSRANITYENVDNLLVSNNGGLIQKSSNKITDIYMNAYNSLTINTFLKYTNKVGLSPELNTNDIENIIKSYQKRYGNIPNTEVLIYGKLELMILKYCPVNYLLIKKEGCTACLKDKYYLDDKKDHKFRLLTDQNHKTRVFDYQNINHLDNIEKLKEIGITSFRIDLLDETEDEITEILTKLMIDKENHK